MTEYDSENSGLALPSLMLRLLRATELEDYPQLEERTDCCFEPTKEMELLRSVFQLLQGSECYSSLLPV